MANIISSNHELFKKDIINSFLKKSIKIARDLDIGCYDKLVLNEDIFTIPQNTILKDSNDCIFESHKKYIDIHIVIEGKETVELLDLSKLDIQPYECNYEDDYFLYSSAIMDERIVLDKTQIAIFGFNDLHKVGIKTKNHDSSVKKVVLKISKNLFEREFIYE